MKLDCPECGGNLFLMSKKKKDKPSWRCCTRPTHVFEMNGDKTLVPVSAKAQPSEADDHRAKVAEELGRGCCDESALLKRLGDL